MTRWIQRTAIGTAGDLGYDRAAFVRRVGVELLPSSSDYASDVASRAIWNALEPHVAKVDGLAYHRFPVIRSASSGEPPDLMVLAEGYQPLALRCLPYLISDIDALGDELWTISRTQHESPILLLEDFREAVHHRFQSNRQLRNLFAPKVALCLPNVTTTEFDARFPEARQTLKEVFFRDQDIASLLEPLPRALTPEQWRLAKSVLQAAATLARPQALIMEPDTSMGAAIRALEQQIALFDSEQEKVAIQVPAGPQRIRGLAGTGKTVLLAMKAAQIHLRNQEARVLFTFNTQSLYNQIQAHITRFYRYYAESDPDWNLVHVRHAWGGRSREGVCSELARRLGKPVLNLREARQLDRSNPFGGFCRELLEAPIEPVYDYVLVDEAQDLPGDFFKVLYSLAVEPKCICFAYDELQTLSSLEMPKVEEIFGLDEDGQPRVTLEGEYPGGIEKDLVLQRSYRCPGRVLMLAHAIGLGIYGPRGCVQMLSNVNSWKAVGYELEEGELVTGTPVVLTRPPENSPNPLERLYRGTIPQVQAKGFGTRQDELAWVAERIADLIARESVQPEDILVVTLAPMAAKDDLSALQHLMHRKAVRSIIPGLVDDQAEFAAPGAVTLTSVFRAKGNEAPVIFVICADLIAAYTDELAARNRAFTAISRAKAWVVISGSGPGMTSVLGEIETCGRNYPRLRFVFPDPAAIKQLDAESTRRRRQVRDASKSLEGLVDIDPDAIVHAASKMNPDQLRKLRDLLGEPGSPE